MKTAAWYSCSTADLQLQALRAGLEKQGHALRQTDSEVIVHLYETKAT